VSWMDGSSSARRSRGGAREAAGADHGLESGCVRAGLRGQDDRLRLGSPTQEMADYVAMVTVVDAPTASFVSAVAAAAARGTQKAFAEERTLQSQWLARALDLREA